MNSLISNKNILNYLVELLVVFAGVSMAFLLESWSDEQKNRRLEKEYLQDFRADIINDIQAFDEIIATNDSGLLKLTNHFRTRSENESSKDSLFSLLLLMNKLAPFSIKPVTYEAITGSGQLNLISNHKLKTQIVQYYQKHETAHLLDKITTDFVQDYVFPFLFEHTSFYPTKVVHSEAFDHRAENLLGGYYTVSKQNVQFYKALKKEAALLQELIESELKMDFTELETDS